MAPRRLDRIDISKLLDPNALDLRAVQRAVQKVVGFGGGGNPWDEPHHVNHVDHSQSRHKEHTSHKLSLEDNDFLSDPVAPALSFPDAIDDLDEK